MLESHNLESKLLHETPLLSPPGLMHGGLLGVPFRLSVRLSVCLSVTRQKLLDNISYLRNRLS